MSDGIPCIQLFSHPSMEKGQGPRVRATRVGHSMKQAVLLFSSCLLALLRHVDLWNLNKNMESGPPSYSQLFATVDGRNLAPPKRPWFLMIPLQIPVSTMVHLVRTDFATIHRMITALSALPGASERVRSPVLRCEANGRRRRQAEGADFPLARLLWRCPVFSVVVQGKQLESRSHFRGP